LYTHTYSAMLHGGSPPSSTPQTHRHRRVPQQRRPTVKFVDNFEMTAVHAMSQ